MTIASSTLLAHWFQFNYAEPGAPWYHAADWPNVFVLGPVVILSYLYSRSKHLAAEAARAELKAAHVQHAEHMARLLDHFDPNTQGGISDVLDRLDPDSPGGIGVLRERLDRLSGPAAQ